MIGLLTALHVLVAVILVLAVLLQSARGADLAGAFGGMGSQTAFGPRGTATFLSKATVVLAVSFMLTSISLAILGNQLQGAGGPTVLGDEPAAAAEPFAPGAMPAPGEGATGSGLPMGIEVQTETVPAAPPAEESTTEPPAP